MDNKKEKAIVKHSNQLAEVPFQNFTAREIDFFYAICYKVQNHGTNKVTIGFNDFRSLIGYTRRGDEALINELKEMSIKFSRISLSEQKKNGFKIIVPFIDFEADLDKKEFTVGVHPEFASALNELDGSPGKRYTLADVIAISQMRSTYSKQCLRMLFLYRNKGYWYPTVEELRYFLDVPEKYRTSEITKRVLDTITREFEESGLFEEFEIKPRTNEMQATAGRKKILGYTFSYKFVDGVVAKENSHLRKSKPCPKCGKPLYILKRKDGGVFWGHEDGWSEQAPCRYTESVEPEEPEEVSVTKGELDAYYRQIREEEIIAEGNRKTIIREKEPDIWEAYKVREQKRADIATGMTKFVFSEECRRSKRQLQDGFREWNDKVHEMLTEKGYPANYLETWYRCPECRDTGITDTGMFCTCRKERVEEIKERRH